MCSLVRYAVDVRNTEKESEKMRPEENMNEYETNSFAYLNSTNKSTYN